MKGEKNFLNLISKLTKPMTRLIKTIMGSQTTTLLRNRFPKHVCIYGLTSCFTMHRLKIFKRIKTLRNTKVFHVPLFYFLQMLYLPSTRIYARGKHRIRMLCPKSVFIKTRIVWTNFSDSKSMCEESITYGCFAEDCFHQDKDCLDKLLRLKIYV